MLFVICYIQPVNCMGSLPLTSVGPSTFLSIGQHGFYNCPPRELWLAVLCASLHTSLPCPSHLHPSVRLHNTGLWKEKTEVLTERYSLILLRIVRIWSLLVCTFWPPGLQTPLLLYSFLLVPSAAEAWGVKPLLYTQAHSYNKCDFRGKELRASSPSACLCTPLCHGTGNPAEAPNSAQESASPLQICTGISISSAHVWADLTLMSVPGSTAPGTVLRNQTGCWLEKHLRFLS